MIDNNAVKIKVFLKKKKKEINLYNAAYELFKEKGINNTSIDEIVKKAGVAKGTFYLYFKDKYDVVNKLVLLKSSILIEEAFNATKDNEQLRYIAASPGIKKIPRIFLIFFIKTLD